MNDSWSSSTTAAIDVADVDLISAASTPPEGASFLTLNSTPTPGQVFLFDNYPESLLEFAVAACVVFVLIGIPGNLCTIAALCRSKVYHQPCLTFVDEHRILALDCLSILKFLIL
jgi:hypothetical protein